MKNRHSVHSHSFRYPSQQIGPLNGHSREDMFPSGLHAAVELSRQLSNPSLGYDLVRERLHSREPFGMVGDAFREVPPYVSDLAFDTAAAERLLLLSRPVDPEE